MEIVKELNLNKSTHAVPNGSLTFAKNIKLSEDGTSITDDYGVICKFIIPESVNELKVKNVDLLNAVNTITYSQLIGNINMPNEIVIVVADYNQFGATFKMFRLIEFESDYVDSDIVAYCPIQVFTPLQFTSKPIIGTGYYNINNELIITFCQQKDDDEYVKNPLYFVNLNTCKANDDITSYTTAPNVPIAKLIYSDRLKNGTIRSGVYWFFIRYKINNSYTNWFPLGTPYYAINEDSKTFIQDIKKYEDAITEQNVTVNININENVNTNNDYPYSLECSLYFYNNGQLPDSYEIGYILQSDGLLVSRIYREFDISSTSFIFNGDYREEGNMNDMVLSPSLISNVKALTPHNNKLYIANYEQTKYNDLDYNPLDDNNEINILLHNIDSYYKIDEFANIDNEGGTILDDVDYTVTFTIQRTGTAADGYKNSVDVNENKTYITLFELFNYENAVIRRLLAHSNIDNTGYYPVGAGSMTGDISAYTFYLNDPLTTPTHQNVELDPNKVYIKLDDYKNTGRSFAVFYEDIDDPTKTQKHFVFYMVLPSIGGMNHYFRVNLMNLNCTVVGKPVSIIEQSETEINKTKINIIDQDYLGTFDEDTIYGFYIHFVRQDGSYTNGFPIPNKSKSAERENDIFSHALISGQQGKYEYGKAFISQNSPENNLFKTGHDYSLSHKTAIYPVFENINVPNGFVGFFISYFKIDTKLYEGFALRQYMNMNNTVVKIHSPFSELNVINYKFDKCSILYEDNGVTRNLDFSSEDNEIENIKILLSNAVTSDYNNLGQEGGIYFKPANKSTADLNNIPFTYNINNNVIRNFIAYRKVDYYNEPKELISLGYIKTIEKGSAKLTYDTSNKYNFNYPSFIQNIFKLIVNPYVHHTTTSYSNEPAGININTVDDINVVVVVDTANGKKITEDNYYDRFRHSGSTDEYYVKLKFLATADNLFKAVTIKKEPEIVVYTEKGTKIIVRVENLSDLFEYKNDFLHKEIKYYYIYDDKFNNSYSKNTILRSHSLRDQTLDIAWRSFDSDDYLVVDIIKGEIMNLESIDNNILIHTRNTILMAVGDAKLQADNANISIANSDVYDRQPQDLFPSDLGFGGLKYNDCKLMCNLGYIWYDTDSHKIFMYNGKVVDLTADIQELMDNYKFEKAYFNIDYYSNRLFICLYIKETYSYINGKYITLAYSTITNKFISTMDFFFNKSIHTKNNIIIANDKFCWYSKFEQHCNYDILYNEREINITYLQNTDGSCIFDMIFNNEYEIIKSIEYMQWIHSRIFYDDKYDQEIQLFNKGIYGKKYNSSLNGLKVRIFNDVCDTGVLDLYNSDTDQKGNTLETSNNYKYPHFNKGIWNFNYIRDILNKDSNYGNISDNMSLVYGNFFIVRFMYTPDDESNIKFDNINLHLNRY